MTQFITHVPDVWLANLIVFVTLSIVILLTLRRSAPKTTLIPFDDTNELKGMAMISIVAIHIGYSLVDNSAFLSPISVCAGVGVDVFLLLSGYGLTMSMVKKRLSIIEFYKQRLIRLALPFWVILTAILLLDGLVLGQTYSWQTMVESYLLYFPTARIWEDINSPFWYMTWLVFFYLLFPVVFMARRIWLSATILLAAGILWTHYNPLDMESSWLHSLHTIAFPLGVLLAYFAVQTDGIVTRFVRFRTLWSEKYRSYLVYPVLGLLIYLLYHTDSGKVVEYLDIADWFTESARVVEQVKSILLSVCFIAFFVWKSWTSRFLVLFGLYSFEIYLIHWPLISRYDVLFHTTPVWLATILSYMFLLGISILIQKTLHKII